MCKWAQNHLAHIYKEYSDPNNKILHTFRYSLSINHFWDLAMSPGTPASFRSCLFNSSSAHKEFYTAGSQVQRSVENLSPKIRSQQSIKPTHPLRDSGSGKLSSWTRAYEKRMQRLSHLDQRFRFPISLDSQFWWCCRKIPTPGVFGTLYWNLVLPCKIKPMQQILIEHCATCYETWNCLHPQISES